MIDHDSVQDMQKWIVVSEHLGRLQRQVNDLEGELADAQVARRLAESNVDTFSKTCKAVEAQVAIVKSRLATSEMELDDLRSKQADFETMIENVRIETREATEKLKDAQFEKTEAFYLQQVEEIKHVMFKRGYDVALEDAEVPEDSPLWDKYAIASKQAPPSLPPTKLQFDSQAKDVVLPPGEVSTSTVELPPSTSDVP